MAEGEIMRVTQPTFTGRDVVRLGLSVLLVAAAGAIGSAATIPAIPTWYAGLDKPFFTPPNGVFGPVWTVLYLMMAVAFWRIWRLPAAAPGRGRAIGLFLVQLALNAFWSVAFFGLRAPPLGLGVIAALLVALVATILAFRRLDGLAAALLVPYLAWGLFAAALNTGIVLLN